MDKDSVLPNEVLVEERRQLLLADLRAQGRLVAADEAARFMVSEDTIKRDLRHLASLDLLVRVRGGALPVAPTVEPYASRRAQATSSPMAELVARRVVDTGGVVVLDGGVTNLQVAQALPERSALTVVTSSPAIGAAASLKGITVLMLGGVVDPAIGAAVDATATSALRDVHADTVVLGTCAVHRATGVTTIRPDEVEFKKAVARAGGEVIAIASAQKLGTVAPFTVTPIEAVDLIVTDAAVDAAAGFVEAGVEVLHV